jgi:hypothetical protein
VEGRDGDSGEVLVDCGRTPVVVEARVLKPVAEVWSVHVEQRQVVAERQLQYMAGAAPSAPSRPACATSSPRRRAVSTARKLAQAVTEASNSAPPEYVQPS